MLTSSALLFGIGFLMLGTFIMKSPLIIMLGVVLIVFYFASSRQQMILLASKPLSAEPKTKVSTTLVGGANAIDQYLKSQLEPQPSLSATPSPPLRSEEETLQMLNGLESDMQCVTQSALDQEIDNIHPHLGVGLGNEDPFCTTSTTDDNILNEEKVDWNAQFIGCPSSSVRRVCKSYPHDNRLWQADLNSLMQERSMMINREWNPYEHMQSRQKYMQFLSSNLQSRSDQYMKPIHSLSDIKCTPRNEVELQS